MHSDVTTGFSSQWKHGLRFTVRAAQTLFLAGPAAALPALLPLLYTVPQGALCFLPPHSAVVFLFQACPSRLPLVCCFTHSLRHSLTHPADCTQELLRARQNYYVVGRGDRAVKKIFLCMWDTCLGAEADEEVLQYLTAVGYCCCGEVQALNPHFLKFCPPFKANRATPVIVHCFIHSSINI